MQIIPLTKLAIVLLPAAFVVIILWRWSSDAKSAIYGLARMIIQLCLIGYALTFIFSIDSSPLVLCILSMMLLVSSWIALRSVPSQRTELYWPAFSATFIVNAFILVLVTQCVLSSQPWYSPSIVIPLAGMIFSAGMNAISLFAERFFSELKAGVTPFKARNTAYTATLIPTINSLFAVGLVSLPGMMTGQILSGISPLIAVRYQIMVMLMLFASSGLSAAVFYVLLKRKAGNSTYA